MKTAFNFTLKALFILKIINFCPDFFVMSENGLIRNVNFKIYDVTNWEKINYDTHIANISRSKHNQKIKYDELVEYNFKFFENSYPKYDCGTLPKPLFKKSRLSTYLDLQSKVLYSLFLLYL